jgi:hypothetical protein
MALIKAKVGLLSHRSAHVGTKPPWWKDAGIDPAKAARKLWNDSRMDQGRIAPGPTSHRPTADRRLPTSESRHFRGNICLGITPRLFIYTYGGREIPSPAPADISFDLMVAT